MWRYKKPTLTSSISRAKSIKANIAQFFLLGHVKRQTMLAGKYAAKHLSSSSDFRNWTIKASS